MSSKLLALAGVLATLPVFAQGSREAVTRISSDVFPQAKGAPVHNLKHQADGSATNDNWSGYVVSGSSFTYVSGSWIVPKVNCGGSLSTYSMFWIGFDGLNSPTVEQIGTFANCDSGKPLYFPFYELYPAGPKGINLTISPGDHISAKISYSNGEFHFMLTDETTGAAPFKISAALTSAERITAEWIAETPLSSKTLSALPLAPFGFGLFGDTYTGVKGSCVAVDSSVAGQISDFGANVTKISAVEASSNQLLAVPSALSANGTSFSVESTAINVTNTYGLPGTFDAYILDSSSATVWSGRFSVASSNGSKNLFLTGLLTPGAAYTFVLEPYGSSGFGPAFSNFILTTSSNLQFSNGTDTDSGLVYAGTGGANVDFSVVALPPS